jgi:hypothetical protein
LTELLALFQRQQKPQKKKAAITVDEANETRVKKPKQVKKSPIMMSIPATMTKCTQATMEST